MPLDLVGYTLFACVCILLVASVWLFSPRIKVTRDPATGRLHVSYHAPRQVHDLILSRDAIEDQQRRQAMQQEYQCALQRALYASAGHELEDNDAEPLPPYTLRGTPGSGAYVDCRSPITVIEEMSDRSIIVRSTRPVLASAGVPILPAGNGNPGPPRPAAVRNAAVAHAQELMLEPVLPGVAPNGTLPVVHLTMSLPPPPKYAEEAAKPAEVDQAVYQAVAMVVEAAPLSPCCIQVDVE